MCEILFRGRRVDNGEWAYGYYLIVDSISYILPEKNFLNGIVEVDPITVGRYSGLTDKNGVRIFEGDIVHVITPNTKKNYRVKFECGQFCVGVNMPYAYVRYSSELIGNIYDNKKLLE